MINDFTNLNGIDLRFEILSSNLLSAITPKNDPENHRYNIHSLIDTTQSSFFKHEIVNLKKKTIVRCTLFLFLIY